MYTRSLYFSLSLKPSPITIYDQNTCPYSHHLLAKLCDKLWHHIKHTHLCSINTVVCILQQLSNNTLYVFTYIASLS